MFGATFKNRSPGILDKTSACSKYADMRFALYKNREVAKTGTFANAPKPTAGKFENEQRALSSSERPTPAPPWNQESERTGVVQNYGSPLKLSFKIRQFCCSWFQGGAGVGRKVKNMCGPIFFARAAKYFFYTCLYKSPPAGRAAKRWPATP